MAKRTGGKYEAILDAAVRVIAQYGYHNTQVSKIAREAKVADGTIYLYFKNKDDVLISVFNEKMGAFINDVEKALSVIEDPSNQLRELIRLHFAHLERDHQLAMVTQIELRQSNPEVRQGIAQILKRYLDVMDAVVDAGIKNGVFRSDIAHRITRKMIFGTIDETVSSWIMNDFKYNLLDQVDSIHSLFLRGIGNAVTENSHSKEEIGT
ncbi:TetR/AcrR family transcriptional regulator [Mechercharimyces sp. CAU 1602]|uniref:TetR/AcrR family transcriptional regulator n=1 Tax=Mechercharimyces sp. CAU 1602 TaxID=2973933 RepID=UPI002162076B|nr:TetR/AcrR family transcriptional regulator [Mechercharimyces sp. CAU 1602]MCS1351534.1 TetR family transcriptional regulator [Mechercharimyces sp. CAU 1602]